MLELGGARPARPVIALTLTTLCASRCVAGFSSFINELHCIVYSVASLISSTCSKSPAILAFVGLRNACRLLHNSPLLQSYAYVLLHRVVSENAKDYFDFFSPHVYNGWTSGGAAGRPAAYLEQVHVNR